MAMGTRYTYPEIVRLAVAASVDARTMARALRGETVVGLAGLRIRDVLDEHGVNPKEVPPGPVAGTEEGGDR
jgi:hypothetical protein